MIVMPKQMDRNDLRDSGRLDRHQNFTKYTYHICIPLYSENILYISLKMK